MNIKDCEIAIKQGDPAVLESVGILDKAPKDGYICPVCGSGTGRNGTGMKSFTTTSGYKGIKCFNCGTFFNNLELIAHAYNLEMYGKDYVEAVRIGCNLYGLELDNAEYNAEAEEHRPRPKIQFAPPKKYPPEEIVADSLKKLVEEAGRFYVTSNGELRFEGIAEAMQRAGLLNKNKIQQYFLFPESIPVKVRDDGVIVLADSDKYDLKKDCQYRYRDVLARYFGMPAGGDIPAEFNLYKKICAELKIQFKTRAQEKAEHDAQYAEIVHADIEKAVANIDNSPVDVRRGLPVDILQELKFGWTSDWGHPAVKLKHGYYRPSRRLLATTPHHYEAMLPKADRADYPSNFWKMHTSPREPFFLDIIPFGDVNLVFEGAVDAASAYYALDKKIPCYATGGAAQYQIFVDALNKICADGVKPHFVIFFDSDETGRRNAPEFQKLLRDNGYPCAIRFLSDSETKTDANDILVNEGKDALADKINSCLVGIDSDFSIPAQFEADNNETPASYSVINSESDSTELLDFLEKKLKAEESAAIDYIGKFNDFTRQAVFSKQTLRALAFVKLADAALFGDFKANCQDNQINLRDLYEQIKPLVKSVKARQANLEHRRYALATGEFYADNDICKDFKRLDNYSICADGVYHIPEGNKHQITHSPIVITEQFLNPNTNTLEYRLAFKIGTQWKYTPIVGAENIADAKKLIQLSCYGFEVNSLNAAQLTGFFAEFISVNREKITKYLQVPRAGYHTIKGKDVFVMPNTTDIIEYDGEPVNIVVKDSAVANALKSHGDVDVWNYLYLRVKASPIARLITAAAIAPCLLKPLHERGFSLYIWALTRSGKSTALKFAASAMGNPEELLHSMDATLNAIEGLAYEHSDIGLLLDEKQQLDSKTDASQFIYKLANAMSRNRMSRDAKLKTQYTWRTISIMTGETPLLKYNATGGAATRVLSIHSADEILSAAICADIHKLVPDHYGFALPAVISVLKSFNSDELNNLRGEIIAECESYSADVLPEYIRYLSTICFADALLNMAMSEVKPDNENFCIIRHEAMAEAKELARNILPLLQTTSEISDVEREKYFLLGEIAANIQRFQGSVIDAAQKVPPEYWGKIDDEYCYIIAHKLDAICDKSGFDSRKLVEDLLRDGFFKPADIVQNGRKKQDNTVRCRIKGVLSRCYRLPVEYVAPKTVK